MFRDYVALLYHAEIARIVQSWHLNPGFLDRGRFTPASLKSRTFNYRF